MSMADLLRKLASWLDRHQLPVSYGRMPSWQLNGLQDRKRDVYMVSVLGVAVLIDLPGPMTPKPEEVTGFTWSSKRPDL